MDQAVGSAVRHEENHVHRNGHIRCFPDCRSCRSWWNRRVGAISMSPEEAKKMFRMDNADIEFEMPGGREVE